MASLYEVPPKEVHKYYRDYWTSFEDQLNALKESSTIYVGNLAFTTPEERIYDLFNRCGPVQRVIMGINRVDASPCGFCFVVSSLLQFVIFSYNCHEDAQNAVHYLNGFLLDNNHIRIEMDWGFSEGRQYGRAPNGGQRRHYLSKLQGESDDRSQGRRDHRRGGGFNRGYRNREWNEPRPGSDRRREKRDSFHDDRRDDKRRRYDYQLVFVQVMLVCFVVYYLCGFCSPIFFLLIYK